MKNENPDVVVAEWKEAAAKWKRLREVDRVIVKAILETSDEGEYSKIAIGLRVLDAPC